MATLAPGQTFAGYRVEAVVGRGGMGVVYRATDLALERSVALKLVAPELAADLRFRERFLRESRLAASLEHAHVLPVYGAGEADGNLYLAMRLVEGEDLKTLLQREGTLEPALAVGLVTQVAGALDAAHSKGLVHRDVKPGNVLISSSGECYLCDFGLTKPMAAERSLTESGQFLGTLDYVAPEQIQGSDVDGRADQYALGCVLYECLAGQPPFGGTSGMAVMWAQMHEQPAALTDHRPELPGGIDGVLGRALAKEPGERFDDCSALAGAARGALGLGGEAPRASLGPGWLRRHAKLVAVIGALLVAAAVAAVVVQLTRDSGSGGIASVAPNSVAAIDPGTNEIVAQIPVGRNPTSIAYGEGAVWVLNADDQTISRIDPETKAERRFGTSPAAIGVAAGEGALWVLNAGDLDSARPVRTVTRVDPDTEATETIELPPGNAFETGRAAAGAQEIVVGEGAVFAVGTDGLVSRIDPGTNEVVASLDAGVVPETLAVENGALWAGRGEDHRPGRPGHRRGRRETRCRHGLPKRNRRGRRPGLGD